MYYYHALELWEDVVVFRVKRRIMGGVFCELISAFLPTRSCRMISDCTV